MRAYNEWLTDKYRIRKRTTKKKKEYQPYDFKCHISAHIVVSFVAVVVVLTPLFI